MPNKPIVFRPAWQQSRSEQRKDYDSRRGSARQRGYDARWDRAATLHRREHPLCVGCVALSRVAPATLVDHIIPHRGNQKLFWDKSNWQSACDWHGNAVKQRLEQLFDQGKVDAGALHLDSKKAIEVSRDLDGVGG